MYRTMIPTILAATAAALALSGCGDDASAATRDGVLAVEMTDFHYGDLPDEVPAGTRLTVTNTSETELHELVAFKLAADDDRTVDEIVGGDIGALLGSGAPATVLLAAPGGEQIPAVGDGTLTEPGRYVLLCVVPTGADPAEYLAAAATSDGPPQVDGGPPHVVHGMFAELVVTG
jgi:hypothetical protein